MKFSFLLVASFLFISIAQGQVNPPGVQIVNQTWMKKNLNVTTYTNGDPIPEVKDPAQWAALTTGAWCHYNNDPSKDAIYGKLYNWYAVNDPRGLAPDGWHVPNNDEWIELITYLGGAEKAGRELKESGTTHWSSPNTGANNSSRFTCLPAGLRYSDGTFREITTRGSWWSATEFNAEFAWFLYLSSNDANIYKFNYAKRSGFSVRCLKTDKPEVIVPTKPQVIVPVKPSAINSEIVVIGNQTWTTKNLDVSKFRNGDIIPEVKGEDAWFNAGLENKPAWCYYNNDPANGVKYGKLYNWAAVNDPRGLAPAGWHVPSAQEWLSLRDYLGGKESAGIKMKSKNGWMDDKGKNGNGLNTSGFTGLPGGSCTKDQHFYGVTNNGIWWSSTEDSQFYAWRISIYYHSDGVSVYNEDKYVGFSVRCIKD